MSLPFDASEVACRLLDWYARAGRDLPWRNNRDPYRIWVSEIMLQQTTVAAVIPYYERFLLRFPTLESLASAPLDDVISLWAGLGYYSRARNLHRAAQQVALAQTGFPETLEGLMALPGVGRSTAGAILSIAFDKPAPILDGNVRRVLVRLLAWQEDPRSSRAEKQLWLWAEALTSKESPHDYAQAIMDLGATLCIPRAPECQQCPLQALCQAFHKGLTGSLPIPGKKQAIPVRRQIALAINCDGALLLRQRAPEGFLGGLWEFPSVELSDGLQPQQAALRLLADLGLSGGLSQSGDIRHVYSHFKLELTVFTASVETTSMAAESSSCRWCPLDEIAGLPLHGAHQKVFQRLRDAG